MCVHAVGVRCVCTCIVSTVCVYMHCEYGVCVHAVGVRYVCTRSRSTVCVYMQ